MKKKSIQLSNILPTNKFWAQIVTKKYKQLKKEYPANPFLTNEQKTELFLDWKNNGNIKSRDKLLDALYPLALQLVHALINKIGNNNVEVQDLEQEANYALLYTLEYSNYDPSLGTLPTYFRSRLPMFFFRALKDYGNIIHIPDNILKETSSEQKAFDDYVKTYGHYPEIGEIHTYNNKEHQFGKNNKTVSVVSGNKTVSDDEDFGEQLFDLISNGEESEDLDSELKIQTLWKIIHSLTKQEQEILHYAYFTNLEISEIVYLLKPYSKYDRERLYRRSKNSLKIITSEGQVEYNFIVYKSAKNRKFNECNSEVIRPISHTYLDNYQERSNLQLLFGAKDIQKVFLNDKDITHKVKIIENASFTDISTDKLFEINCELKAGAIYSLQNYNNKCREIRDKIRKKIVQNYEIFR